MVIVPVPAMRGKAIGTIVPTELPALSLKNLTPNIISSPRKKRIMAPATANDCTSRPNNFNIPSTPGLVNVVDSNAPGGQYVVFNKGSFQNDSYRKQSSSGLTYCDSAKRVDVTISGSGYIVQTETY